MPWCVSPRLCRQDASVTGAPPRTESQAVTKGGPGGRKEFWLNCLAQIGEFPLRLCLCDSRVAFLGRPVVTSECPHSPSPRAFVWTGCLCGKPSPWYCRAFRQILPCLKHKTIAIFFVQALFGPSLPPSCPHLKAQCVALFFGAASGHLQAPPSPCRTTAGVKHEAGTRFLIYFYEILGSPWGGM